MDINMNYFTYGTLMRGKERNYIMDSLGKYIGDFELKGYKMYDFFDGFSQNYPVILYTENDNDIVIGEVWESKYDGLTEVLDGIEGVPYLYYREYVHVDGLDDFAYVYVGNKDVWNKLIESSNVLTEYKSGRKWDYRYD